MNRTALTLSLPFLFFTLAGLTGCARPRASGPWLETARDGLLWVEAQAVSVPGDGTFYTDVPGEAGTPTDDPDLYHGQAQTGWMQGAAGIAAALLRLYLVEQGRPEGIVRLPDEVMPAIAR